MYGNQTNFLLIFLAALLCLNTPTLKAEELTNSSIRPVGTFGGFITKEGKTEIPESNGFLTFAAGNNVASHALEWRRFLPEGKDLKLFEMRFPVLEWQGRPQFVDWSTWRVNTEQVSITLSRTFPAVRYRSKTTSFILASGLSSRPNALQVLFVSNGKLVNVKSDQLASYNLNSMSEPWMILWTGDYSNQGFDVPVLLTFERHPALMASDPAGLRFQFTGEMGVVNLMPLRGLQRFPIDEIRQWSFSTPQASVQGTLGNLVIEARAWTERLVAFPVSMQEHYEIIQAENRAIIHNSYAYESIQDEWGTVAKPISPLPPVVLRAATKEYPVHFSKKPSMTGITTFYGYFGFNEGEKTSYNIPLPHALKRLPIALRVEGDEKLRPIRNELEQVLANNMPNAPSDYYVQNDDIASALMCDAYATLKPNSELRNKIQELVPRLLEGSFSEDRVPVSVEPVTGQRYRSPGKHQYEFAPFDREWYTGRKLAAMARCAEAIDLNLARKNWTKILELYRFGQIFFDWVTGSVLSSVFGFNQLADGIHFNWEGVLGVARLAKHLGDEATYRDAAYRSARQQLALFMIWHQASWSQSIDYGVSHFAVVRLPNHKIETRGAVDAWVEDFGSATLEFESLWQTTNFIYHDNQAQLAFYRDYGIAKKVKALTYEIMPSYHPNWTNGNVMDPLDHKHYGASYTLAHLTARALLFHHDPQELYDIYLGLEGTDVTRQWYTPYFYGNRGPMLLALERAEAPVVEAPVGDLKIIEASFYQQSHKLTLNYQCRQNGTFELRATSLDGKQSSKTIRCKKDQNGIQSFILAR